MSFAPGQFFRTGAGDTGPCCGETIANRLAAKSTSFGDQIRIVSMSRMRCYIRQVEDPPQEPPGDRVGGASGALTRRDGDGLVVRSGPELVVPGVAAAHAGCAWRKAGGVSPRFGYGSLTPTRPRRDALEFRWETAPRRTSAGG